MKYLHCGVKLKTAGLFSWQKALQVSCEGEQLISVEFCEEEQIFVFCSEEESLISVLVSELTIFEVLSEAVL